MVHLHAACRALGIAFDLSAFALGDDRDAVINGCWVQVKATKGLTSYGPRQYYHFNTTTTCCGGPANTAAEQLYSISAPIAYFVLIAMHANGTLYGFRVLSRTVAIARNVFTNPHAVPPVRGRNAWLELSHFQHDPVTAIV